MAIFTICFHLSFIFLIIHWMSKLKAMILRLGMQVWEPNVGPQKLQEEKKRLQKKTKNHFEAARGTRSEKKDNEDDKKKLQRDPESFLK